MLKATGVYLWRGMGKNDSTQCILNYILAELLVGITTKKNAILTWYIINTILVFLEEENNIIKTNNMCEFFFNINNINKTKYYDNT